MPSHATDPLDLSVGQAIAVPVTGIEETSPQGFEIDEFLDRLMAAESGGQLNKKNPRSTALGPFQFIKSTFLFVVNKHFPSEVAGLTEPQILALRKNMVFSRRVARAYTNDLISALKAQRLPATPLNVRIAFLVGPSAGVRLLKTPTDQSLTRVLSADAITANPYMSGATVGKLIQKAAADVSATATARRLSPLKTELVKTELPAISPILERGPVDTAVASKDEPVVALARAPAEPTVALKDKLVAASERELADPGVALKDESREPIPAEPASEIKCEIGRASCRKRIALQEKAQLLKHGRPHR